MLHCHQTLTFDKDVHLGTRSQTCLLPKFERSAKTTDDLYSICICLQLEVVKVSCEIFRSSNPPVGTVIMLDRNCQYLRCAFTLIFDAVPHTYRMKQKKISQKTKPCSQHHTSNTLWTIGDLSDQY